MRMFIFTLITSSQSPLKFLSFMIRQLAYLKDIVLVYKSNSYLTHYYLSEFV